MHVGVTRALVAPWNRLRSIGSCVRGRDKPPRKGLERGALITTLLFSQGQA